MGVRYSYGDFTTRGHGVIEYADSYSNQGGKRKKHKKINSKFATRWPSAEPLKHKASTSEPVLKKSVEKQARGIFKQRYPGQLPKKGQIKLIMKELSIKPQKAQGKKPKLTTKGRAQTPVPELQNTIDTLALEMFARRYPGQQPNKNQLADIRREIADARSKLGL